MTHEEHMAAIRNLVIAHHEQKIADELECAEAATDPWYREFHLGAAARLRAMPYPWDVPAHA